MNQDTFAPLRPEMIEAARLSFDSCRRRSPGETFYAFALVVNSVNGEALDAWCHTEETFARQQAKLKRPEDGAGLRRYCPDEWWAAPRDPIRTARGNDWGTLAAAVAAGYEQCRDKRPGAVLELMIDTLSALDGEGFFGDGAARREVTLMIYVTDSPLSETWWPESVRRLNPPAVVKRFRAAVSL
jgi:hypothetical protein